MEAGKAKIYLLLLMIIAITLSKNGIPIRLTQERWLHITVSHIEIDPTNFLDIIDTVKEPNIILKGGTGELLLLRKNLEKIYGLW